MSSVMTYGSEELGAVESPKKSQRAAADDDDRNSEFAGSIRLPSAATFGGGKSRQHTQAQYKKQFFNFFISATENQ